MSPVLCFCESKHDFDKVKARARPTLRLLMQHYQLLLGPTGKKSTQKTSAKTKSTQKNSANFLGAPADVALPAATGTYWKEINTKNQREEINSKNQREEINSKKQRELMGGSCFPSVSAPSDQCLSSRIFLRSKSLKAFQKEAMC